MTSHLVRLCHVASVSYASSLSDQRTLRGSRPLTLTRSLFFLFLPSSHGSKRTTERSISTFWINLILIQKVYMKTRSRWGTRTPDNPWSLTNEISLTLRFHIRHDRKSKCLPPLPRSHVCVVMWASQTLVEPHVSTGRYQMGQNQDDTPPLQNPRHRPHRWGSPWEPGSPYKLSGGGGQEQLKSRCSSLCLPGSGLVEKHLFLLSWGAEMFVRRLLATHLSWCQSRRPGMDFKGWGERMQKPMNSFSFSFLFIRVVVVQFPPD